MIKNFFYINLTLLFGLNIYAAEPNFPMEITQRTESRREQARKKTQTVVKAFRTKEEVQAEEQRYQDKQRQAALRRHKEEEIRMAAEVAATARALQIRLTKHLSGIPAPSIPSRPVKVAPPLPPKPAATYTAPTLILLPSVRSESEKQNIKLLLRRFHSRNLTNLHQEIAEENGALCANKLTRYHQIKLINNHLNAANGATRYYLKNEDSLATQVDTIQEALAHLSAMNLFAKFAPTDMNIKRRVYFITKNTEHFIQNTLTKQSEEKTNQLMRELTAIKETLQTNNLFPTNKK